MSSTQFAGGVAGPGAAKAVKRREERAAKGGWGRGRTKSGGGAPPGWVAHTSFALV